MNDSHSTIDTQASPSLTTYAIIYVALLALMAATIVAAYLPLGPWNVPVALVIACTKTILVALFFMHVRYSGKLIWVVAAGALVWLAILLSIYHDYFTRDWTPNRLSSEPEAPRSQALPGNALLGRLRLPRSTRGEYYAGHGYYCDPANADSIAEAATSAWERYEQDAEQRRKLRSILRDYTWQRAAQKSLFAYGYAIAETRI